MTNDPAPPSDASGKPRPAEPVAHPAVVVTPRAELERRRRIVAWRRSPGYLLVALLLHGVLVWYLLSLTVLSPQAEATRRLHSEPEPPPVEELVLPEPEPPPIEPPELPPPEELVLPELAEPTFDAIELLPSPELIGLGAGGGRGGRRSGMAGDSSVPELITIADSGFRRFVDELRDRGLDVAFVVDATASMQPFIDHARATIDGIIADLAAVVPDLRLGVVAFRDRTDDWLVRREELTEDRYRIHNFLLSLEAMGGGDFEEAVEEGLRVAAEELAWRPTARRVLILVGDAPPHAQDEGAALATVRAFARDRMAAVSVLYARTTSGPEQSERERRTRTFFDRLARTGGGIMTDFSEEAAELRDRILDASFGVEWREEIRELLARRRGNLRDRIVEEKVRDRDRVWLLRVLGDDPVHPAVVEACVQLFDGGIARRAYELLADETRPAAGRAAMLYLLKRGIGHTLHLDIDRPLAEQTQALARVRRETERLVPPAPAPAPRVLPPLPPREGPAPGSPGALPPRSAGPSPRARVRAARRRLCCPRG